MAGDQPLPEADQSFGERVARADERERTLDEIENAADLAGERAKAYVAIAIWATIVGSVLIPLWALLAGAAVRCFRFASGW